MAGALSPVTHLLQGLLLPLILPKQFHQLGTEYSNIGSIWGLFSFKPLLRKIACQQGTTIGLADEVNSVFWSFARWSGQRV